MVFWNAAVGGTISESRYPLDEPELAVAKAADQQKAILVDVYTDWCGWCKKMDKEVFADPAVSEILASRFATAKVNGESRESFTFKGQKTDGVGIARSFGVRGYPAIIFLDSKGEMLTMIPGFMDAQKFLPVVLFIGNKEYEKMEWDAYLAAYTIEGRRKIRNKSIIRPPLLTGLISPQIP